MLFLMHQGFLRTNVNRFAINSILIKRNFFCCCKNNFFLVNIARRYFSSDTELKTEQIKNKRNIKNGPGLKDFLVVGKNLLSPNTIQTIENIPYLNKEILDGNNRKVYFEIYGCQMNVNDTEVVWSILKDSGYKKVHDVKDADVILVITCAIREGAETKIWNRLKHLIALKKNRSYKKQPLQIGILGCMAERLKSDLLEKEQWVDIVAGPDSYKDLPRLLAITKGGPSAVNVLLSLEETYADIMPVRLNQGAVTAFVSIMRGCDNMCSYCIVPFTRGRERSRPLVSIENEIKQLAEQGIKEITLLGQNVNSYRDITTPTQAHKTNIVPGFQTVYKNKIGGIRFAELLERCAVAAPNIRFRFTSPHPKDFPDEVLKVIKSHSNICKNLHLPAQSGNSAVLDRMRRGYTRETYLSLVKQIRAFLPDVALSSDFICGFCGETDDEFNDTLSLIKEVKYNVAFLFAYSMREKTTAQRRLKDDVSDAMKNSRLRIMVEAYREAATDLQEKFVGKEQIILIEGASKRSPAQLFGRNDANLKVIIPISTIPIGKNSLENDQIKPGDFIVTQITASNSQILKGNPLYHLKKLSEYNKI